MRKVSLQHVSAWNRRVVLDAIRRLQPLSRAELARKTCLEAATTSRLVGDLIQTHLVRETGKVSTSRGRRPTQLQLDDDGPAILVMDLHHQYLEFTMLTLSNRTLDHRVVALPSALKPAAFEHLLRENLEIRGDRSLLGMAVKSTGIVDTSAGIIRRTPSLLGEDFAIRDRLIQWLNVPVMVEASSRIEAWAEASSAGVDDVLVLMLGVGVGIGVVSGGQIIRGTQGAAGELGHTRIRADAQRACSLGHRGCLESLTRIPAIEAELSELKGNDVSFREIDSLVEDPACRQRVDQKLDMILDAVAPVIDAFDPERVVLKGELIEASSHVVEGLTRGIGARCGATRASGPPEVVFSSLRPEQLRRLTADLLWNEILGLHSRPVGALTSPAGDAEPRGRSVLGMSKLGSDELDSVLNGAASS